MTYIVGVIGAAVLFGLLALLRPGDKAACENGGRCIGCTGDGACGSKRIESGAER